MRKIVLSILLFSLLVSIFFACANEDNFPLSTPNQEVTENFDKYSNNSHFENFDKYGQIHNSFLTNVNNSFEAIENIDDIEVAISHITSFNIDYINELSIDNLAKNSLEESLQKLEKFYFKSKYI